MACSSAVALGGLPLQTCPLLLRCRHAAQGKGPPLNPLGLLLSVPPDSRLQALRQLDMRQKAGIWVSSGLLLSGPSAADTFNSPALAQ